MWNRVDNHRAEGFGVQTGHKNTTPVRHVGSQVLIIQRNKSVNNLAAERRASASCEGNDGAAYFHNSGVIIFIILMTVLYFLVYKP